MTATDVGVISSAFVAGPPSPLAVSQTKSGQSGSEPGAMVHVTTLPPATVVMVFVPAASAAGGETNAEPSTTAANAAAVRRPPRDRRPSRARIELRIRVRPSFLVSQRYAT